MWVRDFDKIFEGNTYYHNDPSNKAAIVMTRYASAFMTPTAVIMDGYTFYNAIWGDVPFVGSDLGVAGLDLIENALPQYISIPADLFWSGFTGTYDNYQNEWKKK